MDQRLWLEEVEGKEALQFVKQETDKARLQFLSTPLAKKMHSEALAIISSDEKPLSGSFYDNYFYEFHRNQENPRGVFRRCYAEALQKPEWEILIDFNDIEEPWTYQYCQFSKIYENRCFIYLSHGGKDAARPQEFDLEKKQWISGYQLPLSKGAILEWDKDSLLVTGGEVTESGYPRQIFLYNRDKDWGSAKLIHSIEKSNIFAFMQSFEFGDKTELILNVGKNFYTREFFRFNSDMSLIKIEAPKNSECVGLVEGGFLFHSYSADEKFESDRIYVCHSYNGEIDTLPSLPSGSYLSQVICENGHVFAQALLDIRGHIFKFSDGKWTSLFAHSEENIDFYGVDKKTHDIYLTTTSYLNPLSLIKLENNGFKKVREEREFFKSQGMQEIREWCQSKDGTRIPYTVIGQMTNKPQPTILNAYGGFFLSRLPRYLSVSGKLWLERGGLYVVGNIRGGSEFGAEWHDQVIKENRMKCFEDMAAIAQDLVTKGYTTTEQLGISGGSNGGLLVMGTMVHYPQICAAVDCAVPLIDMERYHLLLAGTSWAAEYGTVEDSPAMRQVIESYNPYRQVKQEQKYPSVLFSTSTYDDRVHPGHARRMYAKMKDYGHRVYYYEEFQGGHGANVPPNAQADGLAISYVHFSQTLGLQG